MSPSHSLVRTRSLPSQACSSQTYYGSPIMHEYTGTSNGQFCPLPAFNEDLATFLMVRGPYAWLGYGWVGCSSGSEPPGGSGHCYEFPEALNLDYGVPVNNCSEWNGSGVFSRNYTNSFVTFDCNTWKGNVTVY